MNPAQPLFPTGAMLLWSQKVRDEPHLNFLTQFYGQGPFKVLSEKTWDGFCLVEIDKFHPKNIRTWLFVEFFQLAPEYLVPQVFSVPVLL